jgi:hypothetical protein
MMKINSADMFVFPDGDYEIDFETEDTVAKIFCSEKLLFTYEYDHDITLEEFEEIYCFVEEFNKNYEGENHVKTRNASNTPD